MTAGNGYYCKKISFVYLTKEIFHKVEARQSKPNTPSSDKETSLLLLPGIWLPGLPGWWAIKDSNLGPTGYEPVALTN